MFPDYLSVSYDYSQSALSFVSRALRCKIPVVASEIKKNDSMLYLAIHITREHFKNGERLNERDKI